MVNNQLLFQEDKAGFFRNQVICFNSRPVKASSGVYSFVNKQLSVKHSAEVKQRATESSVCRPLKLMIGVNCSFKIFGFKILKPYECLNKIRCVYRDYT